MKNIVGILALSIMLLISIQAVSAGCGGCGRPCFIRPIIPQPPTPDCGVRIGGFFGNGDMYIGGLRAGFLQEPTPGMKYSQRVQWASANYPQVREGGYFGTRTGGFKSCPGCSNLVIFGAGKGRTNVFSGFN